jgi:hypothetical protein
MTKHLNAASARCGNCAATVTHDPTRIVGCNCDPDSPFWCYINRDGEMRGWSLAKWIPLPSPTVTDGTVGDDA